MDGLCHKTCRKDWIGVSGLFVFEAEVHYLSFCRIMVGSPRLNFYLIDAADMLRNLYEEADFDSSHDYFLRKCLLSLLFEKKKKKRILIR